MNMKAKNTTLNFLEGALYNLDMKIMTNSDDREKELKQKTEIENVINYININH